MEEYQEAEILWPESIQNPKSFFNWQKVLQFTPSSSEASLSSSLSSNSTCTQDELLESDLSWPTGIGEDSYLFSITKAPVEIGSDEEWQEADVLWPDQESLKSPDFKFAWENCSVGGEDLMAQGKPTRISLPIDIPKRKINHFIHIL